MEMSNHFRRKIKSSANNRATAVIAWKLRRTVRNLTIKLPQLTGGDPLIFPEGAIHGGKAAIAHLLSNVGKGIC